MKYYVNQNAQSTGEHEVHKEGCSHFPKEANARYLGAYSNCRDAINKAKELYSNVDGCAYCVPECHKR